MFASIGFEASVAGPKRHQRAASFTAVFGILIQVELVWWAWVDSCTQRRTGAIRADRPVLRCARFLAAVAG